MALIKGKHFLVHSVTVHTKNTKMRKLLISGSASQCCALREALYKCIDTIHYNIPLSIYHVNTTRMLPRLNHCRIDMIESANQIKSNQIKSNQYSFNWQNTTTDRKRKSGLHNYKATSRAKNKIND